MDFENRDEAMEWIIRNQFVRRNLPLYERAKLALKLEPVIAERAKENLKTSTGGKNPRPCQKSDNPAIDTKKELAQIAGVSHDTIHKVKVIEDKGSE
ncbi:hypothetical protein ACJDU8_18945 [Clostridium sp. WILCCON 0269]|uniref:Uncharacterized protein n=1 Tax=Candidatus Clostridium eludens TaxID=3381663 RepID=A0ABW8SQI7_9CLOT